MKIIQAHVRHRNPGGSEVLFDDLVAALRARGHEIVTIQPDNRQIRGLRGRVATAVGGVYSRTARRKMVETLRREEPDVVHLHNVYPLLTPSVVDACRNFGVPVVMSLHDYKLICPTAQHFRDGAPCRRCSGGREYHCVLENCRSNLLESAAYAVRNAAGRRAGWLIEGVDRFLACSEFVKRRYVEEGFPPDRTLAIPNFAGPSDPHHRAEMGGYGAFIGRLSPEKGIRTLLEAAARSRVPLRIAGVGAEDISPGESRQNVCFVGPLRRDQVSAFLSGARFLAVPSIFEEPFGLAAAEGMRHGLPVIASRIGGLPEIVEDGKNGFLIPPGDAEALARCMSLLWSDASLAGRMGALGRAKASIEFDREIYCTRLERVYGTLTRHGRATVGSTA